MITELLSGLALFLFGMKYMSDSLQQAAGEKLRGVLDKCTKTKFIGVVFGALFTAFIQSSGATTVMEVSFVRVNFWCKHRYNNHFTVSIIKAYGSGTIYYIYWFSRINVRKETIT